MLEYVSRFVIGHELGYGDILTNFFIVIATVVLFQHVRKSWKFAGKILLEVVPAYAALVVIDAFFYMILHTSRAEWLGTNVFIVGYALLRGKYEMQVRLVRASVLCASFMLMLPVAEPLGRLIAQLNADYFIWSQFTTPAVIAAMLIAVVWFMKHFSFDTGNIIGHSVVLVQCLIALITIFIQVFSAATGVATERKTFNVGLCICLWMINLMTYYLFYNIVKVVEDNLQLNALNQKAEFEKEKYNATRINYDELRAIRHEVKNHNFYLKALLEEGKVTQAQEYLDRISSKGAKYLKNFDSGNYAIDVVMNHEIAMAQEQGVHISTNILVPKTLPFRDEDICSMLSNILDNAIEAAVKSGVTDPEVTISIIPRQEYLFIRAANPVNPKLPAKRILSLKTTKTEDADLHGYGTRIIRRIAGQYNGSVKYSTEKGIFTTNVMLEMPEEFASAS